MKMVLDILCVCVISVISATLLCMVSIMILIYNNTEAAEQLEPNKAFCVRINYPCMRL